MLSFARSAAVAALAVAAAAAAQAAQHETLAVQLSVAQPMLHGDVDVTVNLTVTNTANHPVALLKWQLPSDDMQAPLFRITHEDGTPVRYLGRIVKRAAPRAGDMVVLQPGASLSYQVELTGAYDLSRNGRYAIEFVSRGHANGSVALATASPLYVWLDGRSGLGAEPMAAPPMSTQAATITYTGNCTSSQKTTLQSAVSAARNYANNAVSYLNGTPGATQRYVKWFGAYSSSGWSTARSHFVNEQNAWNNAALTLDCSCKDSGTYAYVYPTQPYKIYLCGAFWSAPMTGTDSKGGTLIHEMSHFNVIAGTDDWAYGQSAAASLARSSPSKALDNADNHEYFAENSPFLP
ncbi:M35 family metallo-endopeptidase [Ideonella sp. BN130291]|uniref:M35 family metallo-endopeptidase n=1 Tax=Ideonella sp. BN130291 TaxID=3112940 RepID=UPI002E2607A9|nr:M35 family metallo-endopeptidase [Ideonella sp. BN130291]